MNQNPFAFFSTDANGYAQIPDPLAPVSYLDTRNGVTVKDDSARTSSMSQASHETDSNPSTPSKSNKKSERRTPKSKAEVSERMRRWRAENAEKNRLNDLRCRVYRQARIRFGKDPTPEREAWIQSEIFRRLERRRLREAMKGNSGSCPAPTAIASPVGHHPGGPITRSRSTVHPFPIHMPTQPSVPGEAMGFPATPYAMMIGTDPRNHHSHHQQSQSQVPQQYAQSQHHHNTQMANSFIPGSTQMHSTDIYNGFKFINPLYQGRIMSTQNDAQNSAHQFYANQQQQQNYTQQQQQQQQQQQHYSTQHRIQQSQQQQQHQSQQQHNIASAHTVPSHQPSHITSTGSTSVAAQAAAAAAVAAAAVADLSGPFHLSQAPASAANVYSYYQEAVPSWEATNSSAELSNVQSRSSPSTPRETMNNQPQYTLHAVDTSSYSVTTATSAAAAAAAAAAAIPSILPMAPTDGSSTNGVVQSIQISRDGSANTTDGASSNSNASISTSSDLTAVAAAQPTSASYLYYTHSQASRPSPNMSDVANNLFSLRQIAQSAVEYDKQNGTDITNGLGAVTESQTHQIEEEIQSQQQQQQQQQQCGFQEVSPVDRLAAVAAAAASRSSPKNDPQNGEDHQDHAAETAVAQCDGQQPNPNNAPDMHHLRHNMLQGSFNIGVVPDNVQFHNY